MADLPWMVAFLCVAGPHLSVASPALHSRLPLQVGQNVSLPCNLTVSSEITWYHLRSDQLLPLLTVKQGKLNKVTADYHRAHGSQISFTGQVQSGPVSLEIRGVNETDAGLYFCAGRCKGVVCFGRGVHLTVGAGEEESTQNQLRLPCWSLIICIFPTSLVLCFLCVLGFSCCSGKRAVCCCVSRSYGPKKGEEAALHYASLRYADKPRPSAQGRTGLAEEDVTYATVASSTNPEAGGWEDHVASD